MRRKLVSIGRSAGPTDRPRTRTISFRARRCRARSGSGFCRPNRSDNGPTINCPTAKIARKTVMVEVTAALDTRRSAAIAGSEGRKMLVDRIAVAANAQMTALQAMAVRCLGLCCRRLAQNDFNAHGLRVPCLIQSAATSNAMPALPRLCRPDAGILNNCLLGVVLRMLEKRRIVITGLAECCAKCPAAIRIKIARAI